MAPFCDGCDPEMPRSSAFVESDLMERQKFGFGSFERAPAPRSFEIYHEALRTLAVKVDLRSRCAEELDCILRLYRLNKFVEQQETRGRKAQAFQKERRWRKQRESGRKRAPRLPPALLQEMWREVLKGQTPDGALLTDIDVPRLTGRALAELSQLPSKQGRIKSYALRHVVRGLQGFASRYRKDLAWASGKRPPRQFVKFIREALDVAGVKCPDEQNQGRLVALMVRPRQNREKEPETKVAVDPDGNAIVFDETEVRFLQSHLGSAWTHISESVLRDYLDFYM
jgi:hypothetical protein